MPTCVECGYFGRDRSRIEIQDEKGACSVFPPVLLRGSEGTYTHGWGQPIVKENLPSCGMFYPKGSSEPQLSRLELLREHMRRG